MLSGLSWRRGARSAPARTSRTGEAGRPGGTVITPNTTTRPRRIRSTASAIGAAAVATVELLDLARGVEHAAGAGPERVGVGGDVDRDQRVRVPVGPYRRGRRRRRGAR